MDGQFNFIFRACVECNQRKAIAERHVSSVTLFNSPARAEGEHADMEALRKARNDYHPRKKGVLVKDSQEQLTLTGRFGGASISVGMVGPPQPDKDMLGEVAFSHIQGLFSLLTTEDYLVEQKMRLLPQHHFIWYDSYSYEDWGNPQAVELATRVQSWKCAANIESAQGFFRAILRINENGIWFWALEWNRQMRLVGGISDKRMAVFEDLPNEGWMPTPNGRMRENIPLKSEDDILFIGEVA